MQVFTLAEGNEGNPAVLFASAFGKSGTPTMKFSVAKSADSIVSMKLSSNHGILAVQRIKAVVME